MQSDLNETPKKVCFKVCKKYLEDLATLPLTHIKIFHWFEKLCFELELAIKNISKQESSKQIIKNDFMLFVYRLLSLFALLIDLLVKQFESDAHLKFARNFIKEQLFWCFEHIENQFSIQITSEPNESFVKWMDFAFEKLSQLNVTPETSENLTSITDIRIIIEEVLCNALSISHLALTEDAKRIKGSAQSVIEVLESLEEEFSKNQRNAAMCNLVLDGLNDELCVLEKRVNTSILKLCLHLFTDYCGAIEKLCCFNFGDDDMVECGFDELIGCFDLHVERILMVGLFAVGCSGDTKKVQKMKSCLANLESLQVELVACLKALKMDNVEENEGSVLLLKKFWINQAEKLQQLIYEIIEPSAFLQVIYEEASFITREIEEKLKQSNETVLSNNDLSSLLKFVEILFEFAPTFLSNLEKDKNTHFESVKIAYAEVKSATKVLLSQTQNSPTNSKRVLKRCKILTNMLKRFWLSLSDENQLLEKQQPKEISPKQILPENKFLTHLMSKGQQIAKNRSILNASTANNRNNLFATFNRSNKTVLTQATPLKRMNFSKLQITQEISIDLHITEILESVANMSKTLNSRALR